MKDYCDGHLDFAQTLARVEERVIAIDRRINGSIDDVKAHIEHSGKWRIGIAGVAIGLIVSIMSAVFFYGKLCSVVEDNTEEIKCMRAVKLADKK